MKLLNKVKKAVALGLTMAMAMSCVAFAADDVQTLAHSGTDADAITGSITIDNAAKGETYSIYQIFEMTYSDEDTENKNKATENSSYSYKVNSDWVEFVQNYEYADSSKLFTLEQGTDGSYYLTADSYVFTDDLDEEIMAQFARDALVYATENSISATASLTGNDTNGTANGTDPETYIIVFNELPLGYYLVDSGLGSLCMLDSTDADITIHEKNGTPTVDKKVWENSSESFGDDNDANNDTEMTFQVEIDNINGAVNLVLHDSFDEELEIIYAANDEEHENPLFDETVTLYLTDPENREYNEATDKITLVKNEDYTISVGECTYEGCNLESCAFEIKFLRSFDDVDATGYIVITYKLHLNEDADTFTSDEEEVENRVLLTFGTTTNKDSQSEEAKSETWSFGFEILKYAEGNNTDGYQAESDDKVLADADFELTNTAGEVAYFSKSSDGKYILEGWVAASGKDSLDEAYTTVLKSASDGMIYVEGLDAATYVLEETKAPDGYNMLTEKITVVIEETKDGGLITGHTVKQGEEATDKIYVENNAGLQLPSTGGTGTVMFYLIGGLLIMGAAVVLVVRRRMRNVE